MNTHNSPHILKEAIAPPLVQPLLPAVIEQTARKVFESFSDRLKAALNGRQERALKLALEGHVSHKAERIFSVQSEDRKHAYLVDLSQNFCNCADSQHGHVCKHRLAAYLIEQSKKTHQHIENPPQSPNPKPNHPPIDQQEEALEKARLVLQARSQLLREAIIYAEVSVEAEQIPVEVINLEGEIALVRALPKVVDDQLVPRFPFAERQAATQVLAKSLRNVKIYR